VRHLTNSYLRPHKLKGYEWKVVGPSIMQGGDPIARSVIHARKTQAIAPDQDASEFRLCPVEYARAVALCAGAIQKTQPS
jgi:hypothetical protein